MAFFQLSSFTFCQSLSNTECSTSQKSWVNLLKENLISAPNLLDVRTWNFYVPKTWHKHQHNSLFVSYKCRGRVTKATNGAQIGINAPKLCEHSWQVLHLLHLHKAYFTFLCRKCLQISIQSTELSSGKRKKASSLTSQEKNIVARRHPRCIYFSVWWHNLCTDRWITSTSLQWAWKTIVEISTPFFWKTRPVHLLFIPGTGRSRKSATQEIDQHKLLHGSKGW